MLGHATVEDLGLPELERSTHPSQLARPQIGRRSDEPLQASLGQPLDCLVALYRAHRRAVDVEHRTDEVECPRGDRVDGAGALVEARQLGQAGQAELSELSLAQRLLRHRRTLVRQLREPLPDWCRERGCTLGFELNERAQQRLARFLIPSGGQ